MEHNETGCEAPPEGPMPCVNNCGFFGSAATMNMCSKCHRDLVLKQQQAKVTETCIGSIGMGSSSNSWVEPVNVNVEPGSADPMRFVTQVATASVSNKSGEEKAIESPNRCSTCRKRIGLTGFNCRCGNFFCAVHRYSDKHGCPYDYQNSARDAISKANPVVKAEKLNKI